MAPTEVTPARRALALLSAVVVVAGPTACTPQAPGGWSAERLLLTPTADPATSQTVTWTAAGTGQPLLEVAPEEDSGRITRFEGRVTGDERGRTAHAATATGLEPDTAYRYRVGDAEDDGRTGDWQTFTTAAEEAEPFTFLYFGDVQDDISGEAAPVVRAGLEAEPDAALAVHSGDLVDSAHSDSEWGEWFEAFGTDATAGMNHLASPGNHEYDEGLSDHWARQFPGAGNGPREGADLAGTVHHTDYQGVRFVVLNSNYREAAPDGAEQWLDTQRRWLEKVLADNPNEWTVVTFHHPVFSSDPERDNEPLRRAWLPVLEEYDVDLVLQGHDHSYTRGNLAEHRTEDPDEHTGPVYAVAVTGPKMYEAGEENWTDHGAEVRVQRADTQTFQTVSVEGGVMEYEARTADGRTVDAFTIVKDGDGKRVTDGP